MDHLATEAASAPIVQATAEGASPPFEWCIVEIFGHRRHAGRGREEERFGSKMLRIDVPKVTDPPRIDWETHFYGGASIFSFTLTDEKSVMRMNAAYDPPARYSLPAPDKEDEFDFDDEAQRADA